MRQMNPGLRENLEDFHEELECQRQPLLNSVLGKTLNTSTTPTTTRSWIVNDLLGTLLLERSERQDGRHFHQLFRHVRMTKVAVHEKVPDAVLRDLGRFDDLLLHGALLDPCLRPPRLTQTGWPGTLGRKGLLLPWRVVLLVPLLPGPSKPLTP